MGERRLSYLQMGAGRRLAFAVVAALLIGILSSVWYTFYHYVPPGKMLVVIEEIPYGVIRKNIVEAVAEAVKRDLIFALARCGFDTFEVASGEDLEAAARALDRYSVAYQPGAPLAAVVRQRFSA